MDLFITRRGGSGGFGLRARAYSSVDNLPAVSTNNSIAVISDIAVENVTLDSTRPATAETGDLWIMTTSAGGTEVILGGNDVSMPIMVTGVEQYDGTQWRRVEAYAWMDGEWSVISIQKISIYDNGTDATEMTGGWSTKKDGGASVTFGDTSVAFKITASQGRYASIYTKSMIDVTGYSRLCAVLSHDSGTGNFIFGVIDSPYTSVSGTVLQSSLKAGTKVAYSDVTSDKMTFEVDISSVTGEVYVQAGASIFAGELHELYFA